MMLDFKKILTDYCDRSFQWVSIINRNQHALSLKSHRHSIVQNMHFSKTIKKNWTKIDQTVLPAEMWPVDRTAYCRYAPAHSISGYRNKIIAASRSFLAMARLSCYIKHIVALTQYQQSVVDCFCCRRIWQFTWTMNRKFKHTLTAVRRTKLTNVHDSGLCKGIRQVATHGVISSLVERNYFASSCYAAILGNRPYYESYPPVRPSVCLYMPSPVHTGSWTRKQQELSNRRLQDRPMLIGYLPILPKSNRKSIGDTFTNTP